MKELLNNKKHLNNIYLDVFYYNLKVINNITINCNQSVEKLYIVNSY